MKPFAYYFLFALRKCLTNPFPWRLTSENDLSENSVVLQSKEHQRSRIVQGETGEASPEEIVRSIEGILTKSREKRRHRKSHGRISFGDLARAIADQWKTISPKSKAIFDHYAEVDMLRYRREVKVWQEKKERETEAHTLAKHNSFISQMTGSFSSSNAEDILKSLPVESSNIQSKSFQNDSFHSSSNSAYSSSFNSFGSFDNTSTGVQRRMEPNSIPSMLRRQQLLLQDQIVEGSADITNSAMTRIRQEPNLGLPGSNAFHQSFTSLPAGITDFRPPIVILDVEGSLSVLKF